MPVREWGSCYAFIGRPVADDPVTARPQSVDPPADAVMLRG